MIVGIIPGPHEPSKNINTFLHPLVEELKRLWSGVVLETALICDIPAARKVCGFVGHSALKACA